MTGGLAAPGVRAVLVGTGGHVPGSELQRLPSVDTTLDDLRTALSEVCGMDPRHITRVPARATPAEVIAAVEEARDRAAGPVLFHYAGHGLLGPRDELYLATHGGRSARHIAQAVPYRTLRDLLGEAPHGSIVVLDCCFSGRATAPPADGGARNPFATARPRGSFLLTSASHYALSFAPEGERHTLFTGRLLRLLTEGDPAGPPWLTADGLHAALDRAFADDGRVRPARHSEGTLGSLVIARNRAYAPAPTAAGEAEPPADVPCPYPGLEPFRTEDSAHFFGRDDLAARLLDAVDGDGGPVVLVGASGAGKSSLLRAGLLAGLAARRHALLLPAPGEHPMRALTALWAEATGRPTDEVRSALDAGRPPDALPGRPAPSVLVVDQFEEVFTRCADPRERAAFVAALAGAGPRVVIGLRADHYGSCLDHPELERALSHAITVPPMREADLRAAVENPAAAAGLVIEPGLTERLLHDLREGRPAADAGGAMPFLAHALRGTWLRRSGTRLTLAGYEATGGIWRSVATTGEDLYTSLPADGRRTARELLLRLVHLPPDGGAAVPRHRVPLADLPDGSEEIRDRLARARLLTVGRDTAQMAHEALLRAWPRLRRWIEEDAAALLVRQRLRAAAAEWDAAGRDAAFLYRSGRLEAALGLAGLSTVEREFLAAGEEAAAGERRRETRRRRILRRAAGGLVLALVMTIAATVVAVRQQRAAEEQQELATARALIAEAGTLRTDDPRRALALGLAAHALEPSAETRRSLFETLSGPFRGSSALPYTGNATFSPDGRTLALPGLDDVSLWDVGGLPVPDAPAARLPCRWSAPDRPLIGGPDGRTLAAPCDGKVTLWDMGAPGEEPRRLASLGVDGLPGGARAVALSDDGTMLAAVGWRDEEDAGEEGGALVLWDVTDPRQPRRLSVTEGVEGADGVVLGPDGRTLATVSDRIGSSGLVLWDLTDPGRPRPGDRVAADEGAVFSRDGGLLVTGRSRFVTLVDVTSPGRAEVLAEWPVTTDFVTAFAFSPDGARLATGGFGGTLTLWNLDDPREPRREAAMGGHRTGIDALAFDRDGRSLSSAGGDELRRWDLAAAARVVATTAVGVPALDMALSRDGAVLAVNRVDELQLWDMTDPAALRRIAVLPAREGGTSDLALSADGTVLAAAYSEAVELWDVADPAAARRVGELPVGTDVFPAVAFAPDAPLLSLCGTDLGLWDVSDPAAPARTASLTDTSYCSGTVTFSPDGSRLLVRTVEGDTSLWDYGAGRSGLVPLTGGLGEDDGIFSPDGTLVATASYLWDVRDPGDPEALGRTGGTPLAFHPDGTLLAAVGERGTVELWSVTDTRRPHEASGLVHSAAVDDMLFTPDGHALTLSDSNLYTWDLGDLPVIAADTVGMACRLTDGGFGSFEWAAYVPDVPFRESCPSG
ncbi:caspase family protein [Streptomyces sp. RFCAC02]|uniref:caspase, EACC1-associated type n=1 Tax=Streptomyces sp. RFCAC02 TaxID=2499143 RepID=UPI00102130C0|nr:caspase family protein [Streptomyces sp. RFCAC02]